jgi:hypothetical protein
MRDNADHSDGGDQDGETERAGISGVPMVVAVLAILVWIAFLAVMLLATDSNETQWARMTYVFASVEAIAFAAAGALFGVSVQRERVKAAERKADGNAREAANGRALAEVAIADAAPAPDPQDAYSFDSPQGSADVRHRHADLARRLFPDLSA